MSLINIRNHDDHYCFRLCFTAADSLKHGIDLLLTDQQKANPTAARTQTDSYTAECAHKAIGFFIVPMSFASFENFEKPNDAWLNVFLHQKGDLLPMYISKRPNIEIFGISRLLLYEPAKHHYVLNNQIAKAHL